MKTLHTAMMMALLTAFYPYKAGAQVDSVYYMPEDSLIFSKYLSVMEERKGLPFDSVILETAAFFAGTPYVAATLEKEPEGLVINLREVDCFTFVENVIALSRTVAAGDPTFDKYCDQLRLIRYRDGKIAGYTSRLHYTSDWLYENERKHIVRYVAGEAGGEPYRFDLHFMSSHPGSYKQLKADTSLVACIRRAEQEVNARNPYYYLIPEHAIADTASNLRSGDMVGFVTSIDGLDISHVGIITREEGRLTFIHASSLAMKVIVNPESLREYVAKGKSCIGIMTARPLPPCNDGADDGSEELEGELETDTLILKAVETQKDGNVEDMIPHTVPHLGI
ncbi:MAG: DUF1460 domain-containing protein [Tannerellaceae bacterium]|jgi:hypothetical protein|nr:DUF1460 domain-containing protein [Tannerellaceae bacterium]